MKKLLLILLIFPLLSSAYDVKRVRDALINAHKAGDTEAVEQLADSLMIEMLILQYDLKEKNQLSPSAKLPPLPLSLPPCDMVLEGQNCLKMP